ncbi:MAG: helix-turn-helix domain-containing protein [Vulcanimicrobiaceae bacterium]
MPKTAARALLTDFLKKRRARLDPRRNGFVESRRRRSPGLRRSEVAQLAGISTAWYTLFEMGQERAMTVRIIEPVAKALQLDQDERDYVYDLVRGEPPPESPSDLHASVAVALRLVDDIVVVAYDRWHTPIVWNQAAEALLGIADEDRLKTNALWRIFFRPEIRKIWVEWEHHARVELGLFRMALGRDPTNADALGILSMLLQSADFDGMWRRHEVYSLDSDAESSRERVFHLHHPRFGLMSYYRLAVPLPASAGGFFRILAPSDDSSRRLLSTAIAHHIAERGGRRLYGNADLFNTVQLEDVRAALANRHSAGHRDNLTRLRDRVSE